MHQKAVPLLYPNGFTHLASFSSQLLQIILGGLLRDKITILLLCFSLSIQLFTLRTNLVVEPKSYSYEKVSHTPTTSFNLYFMFFEGFPQKSSVSGQLSYCTPLHINMLRWQQHSTHISRKKSAFPFYIFFVKLFFSIFTCL